MLLGDARVSKSDDSQDTAAQVSALKSAGCKRVFEDKASGGRWDRPELHRLLDQLRAGDTLVVWKLDRLSRSLKDLLHILERVEAEGRPLPLAHGGGRHLRPGRAHADADARLLCRVRARHGPRAHAGGTEGGSGAGPEGGRQPKLTPEQKAEILDGLGSGRKSAADLARLFRVHRATISRLAAQTRVVAPGEAWREPDRADRWHWVGKSGCRRARLLLSKSDAIN